MPLNYISSPRGVGARVCTRGQQVLELADDNY
jgi:hypothetical protein